MQRVRGRGLSGRGEAVRIGKNRDRGLTLGIVMIGSFIGSLNQTVMASALPSIMFDFGIDAGIGQWLTSAYLLFLGVMVPCTGYMMEKISVRKLYSGAMGLFSAGCILAVVSDDFTLLLFSRIVQALGAGILLPLPQVVTFRLYNPEKRGAVMGIVGLATGFAPAFGPTFAGCMADGFGWRSIYYAMGGLSLLSLLLAVCKLKEEKRESESTLDIPSVFLSTLGFGGILTAVTDQGNYGLTSVLTWLPFFVGLVCLVSFVRRQFRLKMPLLQLRAFGYRGFMIGTTLLVFTYGSMLSVSTVIAIYIQSIRGYSATVSGLVVLPGALLMAFLNPAAGKVLDRYGPYLLTVFGLFFLSSGTFLMSLLGENTPLILVGSAYTVRMLGIASLLQPLMTWAVNSIPDTYIAHGTAIVNTLRQVGGAVVSSVFISLMTMIKRDRGELTGITISWRATAAVMFACMTAAIFIMREYRKKTDASVNAGGRRRQDKWTLPLDK